MIIHFLIRKEVVLIFINIHIGFLFLAGKHLIIKILVNRDDFLYSWGFCPFYMKILSLPIINSKR